MTKLIFYFWLFTAIENPGYSIYFMHHMVF